MFCKYAFLRQSWAKGLDRIDIRRDFLTERIVKHCNKLPKEAVESPSLAVSKKRLDIALSSMV